MWPRDINFEATMACYKSHKGGEDDGRRDELTGL